MQRRVHSARGCLCLSISADCVPGVNRTVQKPFTFGLWNLVSSCGNKGDLHICWNRRWNCGLALHIASFDGDPFQSVLKPRKFSKFALSSTLSKHLWDCSVRMSSHVVHCRTWLVSSLGVWTPCLWVWTHRGHLVLIACQARFKLNMVRNSAMSDLIAQHLSVGQRPNRPGLLSCMPKTTTPWKLTGPFAQRSHRNRPKLSRLTGFAWADCSAAFKSKMHAYVCDNRKILGDAFSCQRFWEGGDVSCLSNACKDAAACPFGKGMPMFVNFSWLCARGEQNGSEAIHIWPVKFGV